MFRLIGAAIMILLLSGCAVVMKNPTTACFSMACEEPKDDDTRE
jgi:uncharacterized protein YceK